MLKLASVLIVFVLVLVLVLEKQMSVIRVFDTAEDEFEHDDEDDSVSVYRL